MVLFKQLAELLGGGVDLQGRRNEIRPYLSEVEMIFKSCVVKQLRDVTASSQVQPRL